MADLHTCFRYLYPNIVLIEGIPVGVKSSQLSISVFHLPAPIHRRILLVTEHDAITGLALARSFAALATNRLCFVAFQLSLAASLTVDQADVSITLGGAVPLGH
jgi:hypothetical protein